MTKLQKSAVCESPNAVTLRPKEMATRSSCALFSVGSQPRKGPFSPALSPSEGEREKRESHLNPALKGWAIFNCPSGTSLMRKLRALAYAGIVLLVLPCLHAATLAE